MMTLQKLSDQIWRLENIRVVFLSEQDDLAPMYDYIQAAPYNCDIDVFVKRIHKSFKRAPAHRDSMPDFVIVQGNGQFAALRGVDIDSVRRTYNQMRGPKVKRS